MAIKFEKIKSGMTLYDVRRAKGWDSMRGQKWNIWPVYIKDVDLTSRRVLASWNGNRAEWMSEYRVCKYRARRPTEK